MARHTRPFIILDWQRLATAHAFALFASNSTSAFGAIVTVNALARREVHARSIHSSLIQMVRQMDNKNRPHPNFADRPGLRLVRLDEPSDDERFEEPFYVHAEGSAELRQALERVKELLFRESLIGPGERARRNAGVAVVDLLSALQGRLHGRPDHEATKRIDRVAAAMSNRDSDTLATISLVQAIINESKRFDACGAMPDYSMSCPDSMEDFMSMWPERWMDLPANKFIAAAKAWAEGNHPAEDVLT